MNIITRKNLVIGIGALCVVGLAFLLFMPEETADPKHEETSAVTRKANKRVKRQPRRERIASKTEVKSEEKPKFDLDDEEHANLSKEMRAILVELQDALDNDNDKGVAAVCAKILKKMQTEGESAVPVVVREDAVDALGLSLPRALPELMGFKGDPNPDIREAVDEEIDSFLMETDMKDRELSPILASLAKVLTDEDSLDLLTMSIDTDLRNSVKVATCKQILDTGTEEAKASLNEVIADMLDVDEEALPSDTEQIKKQLDKWLAENPDDEDDDDIYAPDDSDSDADSD